MDDGERTVPPHPRPGAQPREGGEARPKVELAVGDFNDPASLKPAFASVDEAFVVVNGKDLNRIEGNASDRRAFKRLRLRWPQRERGVADEERQFLENGVGNTCASAVRAHSSAPPAAWNVPADRGPSFLNEQGISPSNEGQQDGIELVAFFGQKVFVNPPTPAKAPSSAPQGGPFSSASRRAAVSTSPAKTGFLHIREA